MCASFLMCILLVTACTSLAVLLATLMWVEIVAIGQQFSPASQRVLQVHTLLFQQPDFLLHQRELCSKVHLVKQACPHHTDVTG